MKKTAFLALSALAMLGAALSSCKTEPDIPAPGLGQYAPLSYYVSIPASFDGDYLLSKGLSPDKEIMESRLIRRFDTSSPVFVENISKNLVAQMQGYEATLLHPDAEADAANLTGRLSFYDFFCGYSQVDVGDVLNLSYGSSDNQGNYQKQPGTLEGLHFFDYSTAKVKVTGINGNDVEGFTLSTEPAVFGRLQSFYKFSFTGLKEDESIFRVYIQSAAEKLCCGYSLLSAISDIGDVLIDLDDSEYNDGFLDNTCGRNEVNDKRAINGEKIVYAALRFLPLDDPNANDQLNITVELRDGNTRSATIKSPKGGFKNGNYYNCCASLAPGGAIPSMFIIDSDGHRIRFSKGNLQAVFPSAGSSCHWKFADYQYDYASWPEGFAINGSGSVNMAGTVDLFGWIGSSLDYDNYGIWDKGNSTDYYGKAGEKLKNDWGGNTIIDGGGEECVWRTLTNEEWAFLLQRYLSGAATVNGVPGIIILPDIGRIPGFTDFSINDSYSGYQDNVIDAYEWANTYEFLGAVFLPAAGLRNGNSVLGCGSYGYYWSATSTTAGNAYGLHFTGNSIEPSRETGRFMGKSVRLVMDVWE